MEFLANNKRANEPIHARKGRLAPIALSKLKRVELKIKEGCSPKTNELPKINTLDSAELTQYMSCGGIKLNCRLNLSVEKKRKKDSVPEGKTSSALRIEQASRTDPMQVFKSKFNKKIHFPLRKSKLMDNPQEFKYTRKLVQIPADRIVVGKQQKKGLHAFYIPQSCCVSLYPCESSVVEPPIHPHIFSPLGVTTIGQQRYTLVKDIDCQSLRQLLTQFGRVSSKVTRSYLRQIVSATLHLHKLGLTHNRLNLNTVFHDGQGHAMINWLKSSKGPLTERQKRKHLYFFPPELLLSRNYYESEKNDIWAIGCLALQLQIDQLISNSYVHPYNRNTEGLMSDSSDLVRKVQQMMAIVGLPSSQSKLKENDVNRDNKQMSVLGLDFVSICLCVNVDRRASIGQLLVHPYLAQ